MSLLAEERLIEKHTFPRTLKTRVSNLDEEKSFSSVFRCFFTLSVAFEVYTDRGCCKVAAVLFSFYFHGESLFNDINPWSLFNDRNSTPIGH